MKKLLLMFALCLPSLASAQALQWQAQQRNAVNTGNMIKFCGASPAFDAWTYRRASDDTCQFISFGSNITFTGGVLSALGNVQSDVD